MALQGTLDTFEMPDVLRLLASTKKSGRLHLRGERGEGSVWLADGEVVGVLTDAAPSGDAGDGLFDLFRAREGGFAFEPGVTADDPQPPLEVEPLLAATEQRLAEWREIESIVPSLHAWVSLVPEIPNGQITVDAATWRLIATIGSGLSVGDLARALDLPEVPVSRVVRDLVVLGLGTVVDAPAPTHTLTWQPDAPAELDGYGYAEPEIAYEPVVNGHHGTNGHGTSTNGFDLGRFGADAAPVEPTPSSFLDYAATEAAPVFAVTEPVGYAEPADLPEPVAARDELPDVPELPEVLDEEPAPAPAAPLYAAEPDEDADEVARQLAMLSPRAAQAVAAAAAADTDVERDAHLDALDDADEPINRGLLLKFLSSVKS